MNVYLGIDWGAHKHAGYFMNENGGSIQYLVIANTLAGLSKLDAQRQNLKVAAANCIVGIETAHTLVIDYLSEQGYEQIYVLHPNVVKSTQGRFRQSRAKDDRMDARVIADLLRTDRHRFISYQPDQGLTCEIRSRINLIQFLTVQIVATSNRLWSILMRYYPTALNIFSGLDQLITLEFIQAYPTPQEATRLTFEEFQKFATAHRYYRKTEWLNCFQRLQAPQLTAQPEVVDAYSPQAKYLAENLESLLRTKTKLLKETETLFLQHPDAHIFASLPGAGQLLQPALLSKFGDNRLRFPTASAVQQLAGTCPITRRSGKSCSVLFRQACDHDFRRITQQWASASLTQSLWAKAYFDSVYARSKSYSHALRCLANRWLAILWKLWQDRQPYDENYHLQQKLKRSKPLSTSQSV